MRQNSDSDTYTTWMSLDNTSLKKRNLRKEKNAAHIA